MFMRVQNNFISVNPQQWQCVVLAFLLHPTQSLLCSEGMNSSALLFIRRLLYIKVFCSISVVYCMWEIILYVEATLSQC